MLSRCCIGPLTLIRLYGIGGNVDGEIDKVLYIQHLDRSRYDSSDLFRFNGTKSLCYCQLFLRVSLFVIDSI